jgi:drug/metabolite transporter (DMT)-like permease
VIVAFFILREAITPALLVGGAIILFGVWLVNRR